MAKHVQFIFAGGYGLGVMIKFDDTYTVPRVGDKVVLTQLGNLKSHRPNSWPSGLLSATVSAVEHEIYVENLENVSDLQMKLSEQYIVVRLSPA